MKSGIRGFGLVFIRQIQLPFTLFQSEHIRAHVHQARRFNEESIPMRVHLLLAIVQQIYFNKRNEILENSGNKFGKEF